MTPVATDPAFDLQPKPPVDPVFAPSHLKLNDEQKEELRYRCEQRISELEREMGLNRDGTVMEESWMGKRKKHQDLFDNDNAWRVTKYGGVFLKSNLSLGIAQRFVRESHSKCADDQLGTRPFFAVVKTDTGDDKIARAVEEVVQQKVDESDIQIELRSAIRSAVIRNECVVKVRYVRRSTPYFGKATVMVDETGLPLYSPNGLLIYKDDDFLPDPNVEGMLRLKKDPLFFMIEGQYELREFPHLQQELIEYEGVEVRELDYRSFLCPLKSPNVHEADFVAQLYDDTPASIKGTYGTYEGFEDYEQSTRSDESSGERQPKPMHGEQDGQKSGIDVYRRLAECYLRFPFDGIEVQVFAVLDRTSNTLVFWEYLANVLPKRPFEVIPGIDRVANRWYGEGIVQAILDLITYIDASFNRFNLKDGKEGSIDFFDPNACKDWRMGQRPELGSDKAYAIEPGYDKENRPPYWRVNVFEKSEVGMELMREAIQHVNLMFGVISNADASAANLNSSRTATGILNNERTGNLLIKNTEIQQQAAVVKIMEQVVTLVLENLRDTELLLTKDGKELLTINKDEARTIHKEIRLLLTRSRSSELLSTNQQAIAISDKYFIDRAQDPEKLQHQRPLILASLKALEVADVDELCPVVTDDDVKAWKQRMADAAKAQLKRESRETVAYKDMPPSEQAQWAAEMGFTPASPEERLSHILLLNPPKPAPVNGAAVAQKPTSQPTTPRQ